MHVAGMWMVMHVVMPMYEFGLMHVMLVLVGCVICAGSQMWKQAVLDWVVVQLCWVWSNGCDESQE